MKDIALKDLLEAGCHFGHQANRWNPKAKDYIFDERNGIHIIDLEKTHAGLIAAAEKLEEVAKNGGSVLFIGTKRQAKSVVEEIAKELNVDSNFYFLTQRWPGGLLTNFATIKKNNLDAIVRLREDIKNNNFVTKKEKLLGQRKLDRYTTTYGGLVGLQKLPDVIFLVDAKREDGAVHEASRMNVPIVAIVDTNTDPTPVKFQIPANDDAIGSVKIITEFLAQAWKDGRSKIKKEKDAETPGLGRGRASSA